MTPEDSEALKTICDEASKRNVVWVRGNHDPENFLPKNTCIRFVDDLIIDDDILVFHGHQRDWIRMIVMPLALMVHYAREFLVKLGASSTPTVPALVMRMGPVFKLYNSIFTYSVASYAKGRNCSTVICGHSHQSQDTILRGVRYLNTGAWGNENMNPMYIEVTSGNIAMMEVITRDRQ
jgi:predicted phosphodiesterase